MLYRGPTHAALFRRQHAVASLVLVSSGAATDGRRPIFSCKKSNELFFVIASESDDLF